MNLTWYATMSTIVRLPQQFAIIASVTSVIILAPLLRVAQWWGRRNIQRGSMLLDTRECGFMHDNVGGGGYQRRRVAPVGFFRGFALCTRALLFDLRISACAWFFCRCFSRSRARSAALM